MRLLSGLIALALAAPAFAGPLDEAALDALPPAQVVFLGETHDNSHHHAGQARALAGLAPAAVVWEMLTPDQAARLPEDLSDPETVAGAVGWAESGWPDFALYHPLMLAAPDAAHVGAGVPGPEARRVFAEPLAEVFGAGAGDFGLADGLPGEQEALRGQQMIDSHCGALPESVVPGMIDAQRLRDGRLAQAALEALAATGGPVAVIAGSGHARTDWGAPALVARAAPEVTVLSLAFLEAEPEEPAPFDLWLVTPPAEREDPCAAFR